MKTILATLLVFVLASPSYAQSIPAKSNILVSADCEDTGTCTTHDTHNNAMVTRANNGNIVEVFFDTGSDLGYESPCNMFGYAVSTDGGNSFQDKGAIGLGYDGTWLQPYLFTDTGSGRIYIASSASNCVLGHSAITNLFVSTDNGNTFNWLSDPLGALNCNAFNSCYMDDPTMVVDNYPGTSQGYIYFAAHFNNFGRGKPSGLYVTVSKDDGRTWSSPTELEGDSSVGYAYGGQLAVGPDHSVYIAWWDTTIHGRAVGADSYYLLGKTTNSGSVWNVVSYIGNAVVNQVAQLAAPPSDGFQFTQFPKLAVSPLSSSNLYITYNGVGTKTGDNSDIFFIYSTNGGSSWSSPVRVNDDAISEDQWSPTMAITPDGKSILVYWYDRREIISCPSNNGNLEIRPYGAWINTASYAVSKNFRIGKVPFCAVVYQDQADTTDAGAGFLYMGFYNGAVCPTVSICLVTWDDNRDTDPVPDCANCGGVDRGTATPYLANVRYSALTTPNSNSLHSGSGWFFWSWSGTGY